MIRGTVGVEWKGGSFGAAMKAEMQRRLNLCGEIIRDHARELVSEPYPPESEPGEAPHLRSGRLRQSIRYKLVPGGMEVRIGVPGALRKSFNYGIALEFGTRKMLPRPWLRRSLYECGPRVKQILGAKLPFKNMLGNARLALYRKFGF